jgi:hypothetical protein
MKKEDPNKAIVVRPRFLISTKESIESLELKLKDELKKQNYPCYGSVAYGYAVIKISKKMQHFWSPQLGITMEQEGDETIVRGLYGPKPSVWTMLMFFYSILGFCALILSMVGFTRMSLDKPAEILWWVPVCLLVILVIYFASVNGKRIGKEQLYILHHFFQSATGLKANDQIAEGLMG